jgi:hypothetical protein
VPERGRRAVLDAGGAEVAHQAQAGGVVSAERRIARGALDRAEDLAAGRRRFVDDGECFGDTAASRASIMSLTIPDRCYEDMTLCITSQPWNYGEK